MYFFDCGSVVPCFFFVPLLFCAYADFLRIIIIIIIIIICETRWTN
jgi:hypothetical protein